MSLQTLKIVVVGDGGVGKVFDNYSANVRVGDGIVSVGLWDTAGQEDYDRLRPLSYPGTDLFLVCYHTQSRTSLENCITKWTPEITHHCPTARIALVGLQSDVAESGHRLPVSSVDVDRAVKSIGSRLVLQTQVSALTGRGVKALFDDSIASVLAEQSPRRSCKKGAAGFGSFSLSSLLGRRSSSARDYRPAEPVLRPPELPLPEHAPYIYPESSTMVEHMRAAFKSADGREHDVEFVWPSAHEPGYADMDTAVGAHKFFLCVASPIWRQVLVHWPAAPQKKRMKRRRADAASAPSPPGIERIFTRVDDRVVVVVLEEGIDRDVFRHALEFWYTGTVESLKEPGVAQRIADGLSKPITDRDEVAGGRLHQWLELDPTLTHLRSQADNVITLSDDADMLAAMNDSLASYFHEGVAPTRLAVFREQHLAGQTHFAVPDGDDVRHFALHEEVTRCHCEPLYLMASGAMGDGEMGRTRERAVRMGGVHAAVFDKLVEFLYTEHAYDLAKFEHTVELLLAADMYQLPRLRSLCELAITVQIDASIQTRFEDCRHDVVSLLLLCERIGCEQLRAYLVTFLANNYQVVQKLSSFERLQRESESFEQIEQQQWPPRSYFDDLAEYERRVAEAATAKKSTGATHKLMRGLSFRRGTVAV